MLLWFVVICWLMRVFLLQSTASNAAHTVSVPIRHSLPDLRTVSKFGSMENGKCSSVIRNSSEHRIYRGSICTDTSVLNDGVIPALHNVSSDNNSNWAAELLAMKQIMKLPIVLSFEVENKSYDCVEMAVFNCSEMKMDVFRINIYKDNSFRPERKNDTLGVKLDANYSLSNTSCSHLWKVYASFGSKINSSYFNIEFPGRTADVNYVFVGEVSFLSGARDCEQWPPTLIRTTNHLRNSKWTTDYDDLTYTSEETMDLTSSTILSTNSSGAPAIQNSNTTLIYVIIVVAVLFLFVLLLVFLMMVRVCHKNHRQSRKTLRINSNEFLEDSMIGANNQPETKFTNSVFKTVPVNSEYQNEEFLLDNNIPTFDGIYSNPDEVENVVSTSFLKRNISQDIDEQTSCFQNDISRSTMSLRHSHAQILNEAEIDGDINIGVTHNMIANKESHETQTSCSSLSNLLPSAELEVCAGAFLQGTLDCSDNKLYESIDPLPPSSSHLNGSQDDLPEFTDTFMDPQTSDMQQALHLGEGEGVLVTDTIYAEPEHNIPSMSKQEADSDHNIYESIYSEPLQPSLFIQEPECQHENDAEMEDLCPYSSIYTIVDTELLVKPLSVSAQNIKVIKCLGNGNFGKVVLAQTVDLSPHQLHVESQAPFVLVAVKKLKATASDRTRELFDKEVKFMSKLNHPNVVRMLGVCIDEANPFIMMEYMMSGDLNQYLRTFNSMGERPYENIKPMSEATLTNISLQIASGMQYLASRNFVHRDLAARNCLVGSKNTVKISDFGMSRSLYESHYYIISGHAILPIRWMATECFYGKFSAKTDVWAFGVTLWEIFTLAKEQPYDHLQDQEVVEDALKGPDRMLLEQPAMCPQDIYDIMKVCWVHDAARRPTFDKLYDMLLNS